MPPKCKHMKCRLYRLADRVGLIRWTVMEGTSRDNLYLGKFWMGYYRFGGRVLRVDYEHPDGVMYIGYPWSKLEAAARCQSPAEIVALAAADYHDTPLT